MKKENEKKSSFMIKKDEIENIFFSRIEIAADLLNGYYFHGQEVIESYHLESYDPYGTNVNDKTNESSELRRDILFKVTVHLKNEQEFVFLKGIEVETKKNYHMFYRVLQYNASTNLRIVDTTHHDYVVDTLVVTTSKISWNSTTLYDLYHVPNEIQPMIGNSPFHVLNLRTANPEWFHHPELKILIKWFNVYDISEEESYQFLNSLGTLPKYLVYMIAALAENKDIFDLIEEEKGEEVKMEDFVEKLLNKATDKGFDKGFDKGVLETTIKNLIALMQNTGWSLHKAMDMNNVSEDLRPSINEWFRVNGY
ncbi:MAG: Rpn family recombination-promoting nuclease/putative transposase [Erysipelotrichaceae bacterium]|nr:Rpn family recombination-promoting nuclease/putative transposase [Erysipelotrichaceae bacterium]